MAITYSQFELIERSKDGSIARYPVIDGIQITAKEDAHYTLVEIATGKASKKLVIKKKDHTLLIESHSPTHEDTPSFEVNILHQEFLSSYEQQLTNFKQTIEGQHREIISTMAVILKAIEDEQNIIKKSQLLEMQSIFNRHFKYEEWFMKKHGYPDYHISEHKKAHGIMNHYLQIQLKHREEIISKEERKKYRLSLLSLLNDVDHDSHFLTYMEELLSEVRQTFNEITMEPLNSTA